MVGTTDKKAVAGNKFGKECRLRHRTFVEGLFSSGKGLCDYPLRLQWRAMGEEELAAAFPHGVPEGAGGVQAMFTVPKRKRRRAVDRVLTRRRIREAYRLSRGELETFVAEDGKIASLQLAFIYLSAEDTPYNVIEKKMRRLLAALMRRLAERGK